MRMTIDFSLETMQVTSQWNTIFKMLKEKYKLRYVDKIDKVKDGIQLLNTFLELIK